MRARNIKPGFFENEELAECSPLARLCFIGLWLIADKAGRLEDRPKRIKKMLFGYEAVDVNTLLSELQQHNFIFRYVIEDQKLIQVLEFQRHQHPHHAEKESCLPEPHAAHCDTLQSMESKNKPQNGAKDPHEPEIKPGQDSGDTHTTPKQAQDKTRCNPSDSLIPDSLIPRDKRTVAGATAPSGASTPTEHDETLFTSKEIVWLLGIALLGEGGRSLLGKLVNTYGEVLVADALSDATREKPGEPRSWLSAACAARAKAAKPVTPNRPPTAAERRAETMRLLLDRGDSQNGL